MNLFQFRFSYVVSKHLIFIYLFFNNKRSVIIRAKRTRSYSIYANLQHNDSAYAQLPLSQRHQARLYITSSPWLSILTCNASRYTCLTSLHDTLLRFFFFSTQTKALLMEARLSFESQPDVTPMAAFNRPLFVFRIRNTLQLNSLQSDPVC